MPDDRERRYIGGVQHPLAALLVGIDLGLQSKGERPMSLADFAAFADREGPNMQDVTVADLIQIHEAVLPSLHSRRPT